MGTSRCAVVAMMKHPRSVQRSALTLMEVVVSSLLVGTVLISSLSTTVSWRQFHHSNRERDVVNRLAEELLSEIVVTSFRDPTAAGSASLGRESGELADRRFNWNDVDDYNGMNETSPKEKSGVVIADATGYQRSAMVAAAVAIPQAPGYSTSQDLSTRLRLIEVTVVGPSGVTVSVRGLKSDLETEFPSGLTHVRSVAFEVTDRGSKTIRSIGMPNYPVVTP